MSSINNKYMRNDYNPYDHHQVEDTSWGLRHAGTWPSDWAPRRTCQLCKKEFRTDKEEGFSSYLVDVCTPCIHTLVKAQAMEKKRLQEINDAPFKSRMDEINTQ